MNCIPNIFDFLIKKNVGFCDDFFCPISMPYDCQDQLYEIGLSLLHLQTMYVHLVC